MFGRYEKEAYQFLSAYRFLSYALAVIFIQVDSSGLVAGTIPEEQLYIILGCLGLYTVLRVFSPLRWRERGALTYLILLGDFLICMALLIYTNGLNSGFLLYSLTPVMTAALLFDEKIALSLAASASILLSVTHLALSNLDGRWTWIMVGNNLTLLVVYTLFSIVTAIVPYRINLNIRRRIEREATIEERRRIAREIHDGVAQALGYLNLKTKLASDSVTANDTEKTLRELGDIRKVVQDTYDDIRESIDQLSSEIINIPIVSALNDYVKEFGIRNQNIKVKFECPRSFPNLSPIAEIQLLRIAQESLTNVRRHSSATEVEVRLTSDDKELEMLVKDNGKGFNMEELKLSPTGYHGLNIIKERAESLGGRLSISAASGEGTVLVVSMPLDKVRL